MFKIKIVWSADVTPLGQGINGLVNCLLAGQHIISLWVYYDLYGINTFICYLFRAPSAGFGPKNMVGLDGQANETSSKETARWRRVFQVNKNMSTIRQVCLYQCTRKILFFDQDDNGICMQSKTRNELLCTI